MVTTNPYSTQIINMDATPRTPNNAEVDGGILRVSTGVVEIDAADTDGSVYHMVRLPSNARVVKIDLINDAITAGTSYDIGLYRSVPDGAAVVDDNVFADTVDMSSERAEPLDVTFEILDQANVAKKLWELAALTADPHYDYDICLTADTVGSAAGTVALNVYWTL